MKTDQGVIYVILEHFARHLYPEALEMDRRLRDGEPLSDRESDRVSQILQDIRLLRPLIDRHPEHRDIAVGVIDLYTGIASRARTNEDAARAASRR